MNKKAFTLIELLAVIVILAIIALIATPIILGIINSTREEARKRSAEAVSHAVETAYIQTAMKAETNGSASLNNENVIGNTKIDNERSRTTTSITTNDGVVCTLSSDYVLTCTYGSDTEPLITPRNVSNGTEVVESGPDYYYFSWGWNATIGTTTAPGTSNEPPTGYNYYVGYNIDNGVISEAWACFIGPRDGKEYCLKGGDGGAAFSDNQKVLNDAYGQSACEFVSSTNYYCSTGNMNDVNSASSASKNGLVVGGYGCDINQSGNISCPA